MKRIFFIIGVVMLPMFLSAQNQNSIWVLGDSAGVDFSNVNNPVPISSVMRGRGSSASICDINGHLLFYSWTVANTLQNSGRIYNWQHQPMVNGDSIVGEAWYQELLIVPMPDSIGFYYLFSIGVTSGFHQGLYYSIIDMNANGGLGQVLVKNVQLSNLYAFDAIVAVKHGNGRDWWLIFKPDGYHNSPNNDFYIYLITPSGISLPTFQSIGYIINTGGGQISFSKQGDKILLTDWMNLIQIINFDRCTGFLSNANIIEPEHTESGEHVGNTFSPDGNLIYITHLLGGASQQDSWLYQYNLNAGNIAASRDTLYYAPDPAQQAILRLAPDNKIYLSIGYYAYYFPYPDSMYYPENMNLSVINRPDSLGDSCLFAPYSFYLGGKRTYYGLPNNPDYEMGPLIGSGCDSLVGVKSQEFGVRSAELHVFYHPGWQVAFVNAEGLKGKNYSLHVYDLTGMEVFREEGKHNGAYFTRDLRCEGFANGMYVVNLRTENEVLSKKFIKQ